MALRTPTTVKPDGTLIKHRGTEDGAGRRFVPSDAAGPKLVDTLNELLRRIGEVLVPLSTGETSAIYFEDVAAGTAGETLRLNHNAKRRVRWCVCDWTPSAAGTMHALQRSPDSTDTVLVLRSYAAGTATIRVW